MSSIARLIEKFSLAIHGESTQDVIAVLASFTATVLARWEIPVEEYVIALTGGQVPRSRRGTGNPPVPGLKP